MTRLTIQAELENEAAIAGSYEPAARPSLLHNTERQISINTDLSFALEIPTIDIESARDSGDETLRVVAEGNARENYPLQEQIDQDYEDGVSPEEASERAADRIAREQDMTASEYIFNQSLVLANPDVNPYAARVVANTEIFDRLMAEKFDENEQGIFSKILTFLDVNILREMTIGSIENLTYRSNREGSDIQDAFLTLTPREFEDWAKDYIEERSSEGVFSEDSIWNLYKIVNDEQFLGDDPLGHFNAVMGAADAYGIGAIGARTVRSLGRSRRPVDAIAEVAGEVDAGTALGRYVEREGIQTDKIMAGRAILDESLDPVAGASTLRRPSPVTYRNQARKPELFEKLEAINKSGHFGEYLPEATIRQLADEAADSILKGTSDVGIRLSRVIDEGSNDYKVRATFGKEGTGGAFPTREAAEKIASRDPALTVVKAADVPDADEAVGYFIQVEKRLDLTGAGDMAEVVQRADAVTNLLRNIQSGDTKNLGPRVGAKIMQAEAKISDIPALFKPYRKAVSSLRRTEQVNLRDFFERLRDGDLSYMRAAPDGSSFKALYAEAYGQFPSDKVIRAYTAVLDVSDTAWHISSSARLKQVVNEGGEVLELADDYVDLGYRTPLSSIPEDELVLDVTSGMSMRPSEISGDAIVFKVPDTFAEHLYVTGVRQARQPNKLDVMPYNVGGPRDNSDMRWFVGSATETTLASGNSVNSAFKTILGSFGQKQAKTAVRQLNNITRGVKELLEAAAVKNLQDLRLTAKQTEEMNALIRRNNDWNPNITDFGDLVRVGAKHRFRFTEEFAAKARDEKITIKDAGTDPSLTKLGSFGDLVNSRINMRRRDTPLMNYGGGQAVNANPISAIAEQFGSEVYKYANAAATKDAIEGWVKLARTTDAVTLPAGIGADDYQGLIRGAVVSTSGDSKDITGQLLEQQNILLRRMGEHTRISRGWEKFTKTATESIFSGTGIKLDLTKTDVSSRLLQVGFYSKFGFFNPDQFLLQGLHSLVIVGASPIHGARALTLGAPVKMIASLPDDAARVAIKRAAATKIATEEELTNLVRYVKESGRANIDNQIVELQGAETYGSASNLLGRAAQSSRKVLDVSTIPFRAGESITRTTSMITAVLEHGSKRVGEDAFSPTGLRWIANREQDLSFRMTTSSKGAYSQGIARVPTQWLSYSFRALENITIGRDFTVGEKLGMAAVMGPLWGLTGMGIGSTAGFITEKMGFDPNDPEAVKFYNDIKYGLGDHLIGEFLGVDTAYAERVAPLGQLADVFSGLFEDSLVETLFGPSGSISNDIWSGLTRTLSSVQGQRWYIFNEDLEYTLRNISTYDKVLKIKELIFTGQYQSRTNRTAAGTFDGDERMSAAGAVAFGAQIAAVNNWYNYNEIVREANQEYQGYRNEVLELSRQALTDMTSSNPEDLETGIELYGQTMDYLWTLPLSNELKLSIQRSMVNSDQQMQIMRNAIRLGLPYEARIMEQQR